MSLLLPICVFAMLGTATAAPAAETGADDLGARQPVAETPWFTFHSHFGFNLYDAVLTSATARRDKRADPLHEGPCFSALVLEERAAWDAAVSYYAETVAATHDFGRERAIVRAHLTGIEIPLDDDDRRDLRLSLLFLRAAAPAWRACRWKEQDSANQSRTCSRKRPARPLPPFIEASGTGCSSSRSATSCATSSRRPRRARTRLSPIPCFAATGKCSTTRCWNTGCRSYAVRTTARPRHAIS